MAITYAECPQMIVLILLWSARSHRRTTPLHDWNAQRADLHPRRRSPVREPRHVLFQYVVHGYTSVGSYDRMREFDVPQRYEGQNHRRHRRVNSDLWIPRKVEVAELGTDVGVHA